MEQYDPTVFFFARSQPSKVSCQSVRRTLTTLLDRREACSHPSVCDTSPSRWMDDSQAKKTVTDHRTTSGRSVFASFGFPHPELGYDARLRIPRGSLSVLSPVNNRRRFLPPRIPFLPWARARQRRSHGAPQVSAFEDEDEKRALAKRNES